MNKTIDLTTKYMGLTLKNPLVASPSPDNSALEHLIALEKAGISAVVLPSLFQEQIEAYENQVDALSEVNHSAEAQSYLPKVEIGPYGLLPTEYLTLIKTAKEKLSIPVIASINGYNNKSWGEYAKLIEDAGADALELNIYSIPTDLSLTSTEIEHHYLTLIETISRKISIPLAVKMGPYFTSVGNIAEQFVQHGASGVVLFNRFMQPDISINNMQLSSKMLLSEARDLYVPLHWVGILANRINASIAASGGVNTGEDVVKYLLAGADVVMATSSILRNGPTHVATLLKELNDWLKAREQNSLDLMRGQFSWAKLKNKEAYERIQYMRMMGSYHK